MSNTALEARLKQGFSRLQIDVSGYIVHPRERGIREDEFKRHVILVHVAQAACRR